MSTETFLAPNASRIACDVFVREKVLGPEDVVYGVWHVVISIPANVCKIQPFPRRLPKFPRSPTHCPPKWHQFSEFVAQPVR